MSLGLGGQPSDLNPLKISPEELEFRKKLALIADPNKKVASTPSGRIMEIGTSNFAIEAFKRYTKGSEAQLELQVMLLLTEGRKWLKAEDNELITSIARRMNLIEGVDHTSLNNLVQMICDRNLHQEREYDKVLKRFVTKHEHSLTQPLPWYDRMVSSKSDHVMKLRVSLDLIAVERLIPPKQRSTELTIGLKRIFERFLESNADTRELRRELIENIRTIPEEYRVKILTQVASKNDASDMIRFFSLFPSDHLSNQLILRMIEYYNHRSNQLNEHLEKITALPPHLRICGIELLIEKRPLFDFGPRTGDLASRPSLIETFGKEDSPLTRKFLDKFSKIEPDERVNFINLVELIPAADRELFLDRADSASWSIDHRLVMAMPEKRRINIIFINQLWVSGKMDRKTAEWATERLSKVGTSFIEENLQKISPVNPRARLSMLVFISERSPEKRKEWFDLASKLMRHDNKKSEFALSNIHKYNEFIHLPVELLEIEFALQFHNQKETGHYINILGFLPPALRIDIGKKIVQDVEALPKAQIADRLSGHRNIIDSININDYIKTCHDYIDQMYQEAFEAAVPSQKKMDQLFLERVFEIPEKFGIAKTDARYKKLCALVKRQLRLDMHTDPLTSEKWDNLVASSRNIKDIEKCVNVCRFLPEDMKDTYIAVGKNPENFQAFLEQGFLPRKTEIENSIKAQLLQFWTGRNKDRKAGYELSNAVVQFASPFGFDIRDYQENIYDNVYELAQGVKRITSATNNAENPYYILETLKTTVANEAPFTLEEMDITPSATQVNPVVVREKAGKNVGFVYGDFPESVKPGDFQKIFDDMKERLSKLPAEDQEKAGKEIAAQNKKGRTHLEIEKYTPTYIRSLVKEQAKNLEPNAPVEESSFIYFGCIMKMISEKSDEIPPGSYFSEKETLFLKFVSFIDECLIGQIDGLLAYYNLPEMANYRKNPGEKAESGHKERVEKQANQAVQDSLNGIIANDDFLKQFIKKEFQDTRAHQVLYVKNRCAHQIGLTSHKLTFEPYAGIVKKELLEADPKKMTHEIFKRLDTKTLVEALRVVLKEATKVIPGKTPSSTFTDLWRFFNDIPGKLPEEGWEEHYLQMEGDACAGVTELGAKTILKALGYIPEG